MLQFCYRIIRTSRTFGLNRPELREWIEWRVAQATPEARLRGEIALLLEPDGAQHLEAVGT